MSSVSEIFLMHLKASSMMNDTSDITIVQDNANTSFNNSLSFCFSDSRSCDSTFWTATQTRRRGSSSRWEPAADAVLDDQPDIPTRQDSSRALISKPEIDDETCMGSCHSWDEDESKKDVEPKKPRRQTSKRDLMLARVPRRQGLDGSDNSRDQQVRIQRRGRMRRIKTFPKGESEGAIAA